MQLKYRFENKIKKCQKNSYKKYITIEKIKPQIVRKKPFNKKTQKSDMDILKE